MTAVCVFFFAVGRARRSDRLSVRRACVIGGGDTTGLRNVTAGGGGDGDGGGAGAGCTGATRATGGGGGGGGGGVGAGCGVARGVAPGASGFG
ncbi:MAG TPA: hypothetical protein VG144_05730 [Gaiellaceae bacterium]|nr:hypothetical protein [Gaiellaceae bacterium]